MIVSRRSASPSPAGMLIGPEPDRFQRDPGRCRSPTPAARRRNARQPPSLPKHRGLVLERRPPKAGASRPRSRTPSRRPIFIDSEKVAGLGPMLFLRDLLPVFCLQLGPGERRIFPNCRVIVDRSSRPRPRWRDRDRPRRGRELDHPSPFARGTRCPGATRCGTLRWQSASRASTGTAQDGSRILDALRSIGPRSPGTLFPIAPMSSRLPGRGKAAASTHWLNRCARTCPTRRSLRNRGFAPISTP